MKKVFTASEYLKALGEARKWLEQQGYFLGTLQGEAPMGIAKSNWVCTKWVNFTIDGIRTLEGYICAGDKRFGDITVVLFDEDDLKTTDIPE